MYVLSMCHVVHLTFFCGYHDHGICVYIYIFLSTLSKLFVSSCLLDLLCLFRYATTVLRLYTHHCAFNSHRVWQHIDAVLCEREEHTFVTSLRIASLMEPSDAQLANVNRCVAATSATTVPHKDDAAFVSNGTASSASAPPTAPRPVIPGAQPYRFYRVPPGMKQLRNKRKVAIVFGYNGERYCGLQWNHKPEYPTIEEALLKALFETDMISAANFCNEKVQPLLNFERASRTDKGVHALCNVVNVCVMLPYDPLYVARMTATDAVRVPEEGGGEAAHAPEEDTDGESAYSCAEAKRLLNLALPEDIHVFDVVPVTRSFNCYLNCGGRKYEYYIPTFSFMTREDYVTRYFPSSLAPAQPSSLSLDSTGEHADSSCGAPQHSGPQPLTDDVAGNEVDGCYTLYTYTHQSEEGGARAGRKSKGHFPQRKSKRPRQRGLSAQAVRQSSDSDVFDMKEEDNEGAGDEATETNPDESHSDDLNRNTETIVVKKDEGDAQRCRVGNSLIPHRLPRLEESMTLFRCIPDEAMRRVASYRISAAQLSRVRAIFSRYEGTHSFHNFTPGGYSGDASCHRFIRHIHVSEPMTVYPSDADVVRSMESWSPRCCFSPDEDDATTTTTANEEEAQRAAMRDHVCRVYGESGLEVVRICFDGQSFMLNQIRKMIGAVVCITATGLAEDYVTEVLLRKGVQRGIPMAPANGLFLVSLDFSGYNARLARIQRHGNNGANKRALDVCWVDATEMAMQRRRIAAVVLRNEMARDRMGTWMRSLRHVVRLTWHVDLP